MLHTELIALYDNFFYFEVMVFLHKRFFYYWDDITALFSLSKLEWKGLFLLTLLFLKMQSHLEAALLGHGSNATVSSNAEDDEKDFQDEDGDDVDDFIDEVSFFSGYDR